jgi:uncharacterized protein YukE
MSGYENPRIPNGGEHPDSWEHSKINNTFEPLNPTDAINQANKYWQARIQWEQGVETFARSIQTSIAQAWSGAAAEQSKSAIAKYTGDAQNLTTSLEELYNRVSDAATAISNTKNALPETVEFSFGERIFNPRRWNLNSERYLAEQDARAAMQEFYVQPFSEMDGKIPVLPTPVGPTASVDIPAPPPGGYHSDDSGGPTTDGPGTSPTDTGAPGDKDGDGKPDETSTEEPQSTDESTQDEQSSDTTATDTSTTPAGVDPTSTTPAGTTDPTKTVPAGTPTPHSPGSPGSPGTPGTTNQPQPGRSIAGAPGTPSTSVSPAAATNASVRGTSGTPGMMAPGARGGGKDDESEHKTPDYLITQENTDELLGEVPRTLPGGVIGGTPD